ATTSFDTANALVTKKTDTATTLAITSFDTAKALAIIKADNAATSFDTATTVVTARENSANIATKATASDSLGKVVILMYHNILPDSYSPRVYSVSRSALERDFQFLANNGYNVISFEFLRDCIASRNALPPKSVILTFDDGYYNNLRYGLPLLQKYNYSALFSVVGEYTAYGKTSCEKMHEYMYLDWDDMRKYSDCANIEWGLHSTDFHKAEKRQGARIMRGESVTAYRKAFVDDTNLLSANLLSKCGINSTIYTYPYGLYCKESEQFLQELGFQITLSCYEGVNDIKDASSLLLMRRYNRSGENNNIKKLLAGLG
ncbi:MAG: polysaccharide deacetylase family protein, partial [Clostridia bacterium]